MMSILMKRLLVLSTLILFVKEMKGQDIQYVKTIVDTLCSPTFFGRGYLKDGVNKSGKFIAQEMKRIGLDHKGENAFFQNFQHSIQIFSQEPKLVVNGTNYALGKDYLFKASSCSDSGVQIILNQINPYEYKSENGKVVLQYVDKPNFSASTKTDSFITFYKNKDLYQGNEQIIVDYSLQAIMEDSFSSSNIIGMVEGTRTPDEYVILCAHYDHLGGIGNDIYFPGANDNASGVSMMLDIAQHIQKNPLPYSVLFIAFAGEEAGLLGSAYFVRHPTVDLKKVKFVLNLDLVGNGEEGIAVVNGLELPEWYSKIEKWNQENRFFSEIQGRGKAPNSDHYYFYEKGIPSLFIYSKGGKGYYHDIYDAPNNLQFSKYNELFQLSYRLLTNIEP